MAEQPNYYDLSGPSTRIAWYPKGTGGPVKAGAPRGAPVLHYSGASADVSVSGDDLTIAKSPAGTLVAAVVKKTEIVPGGVTSVAVLIPDANVGTGKSTAIQTVGVLSVHRATAQIGPGQLETYTTLPLVGTAASIILPD